MVRSIALHRDVALTLLRAQLELIEEASEHGSVVLSTPLPGNGRAIVPVRMRVSYPAPRTPRFGVAIDARTAPSRYPSFRGELALTEAGTGATILTLDGMYHAPYAARDGIAPRPSGLEHLLSRLVAGMTARD